MTPDKYYGGQVIRRSNTASIFLFLICGEIYSACGENCVSFEDVESKWVEKLSKNSIDCGEGLTLESEKTREVASCLLENASRCHSASGSLVTASSDGSEPPRFRRFFVFNNCEISFVEVNEESKAQETLCNALEESMDPMLLLQGDDCSIRVYEDSCA